MSLRWRSHSVTHVGKKRTVNQDAIFADDAQCVWLVADGMGGHSEGDKASQAIVSAFSQTTFSHEMSERIIQIETVLRLINDELQHYSSTVLSGKHTGSTAVVLTVCQGYCALIWAGDSRCYRIFNNQIQQVGWDHSHVEEMLRAGHITAEEAATSSLSNVITRAIGAHKNVYFDHVLFPFNSDEIYLICSDGLTNELIDDQILATVSKHGNSQSCIDNLLEDTLENGARDNVSIITMSSEVHKKIEREQLDIIQPFDQKLAQLSKQVFDEDITIDDYYLHLRQIVNQLSQDIDSFDGQSTQEVVTPNVIANHEMPTNNYPKVTNTDLMKHQFGIKHMLLLVVVIVITAGSLYFSIG